MTDTDYKSKPDKPKRPFFLSFLCVVGFTYTSLFSLLFLLGMLYATGISGILNKYLQLYDLSRLNFFLFSIAGFIIFFSAFVGILLMWKMQKLGFYIYTISAIIFLAMELVIAGFYLPDILIHALFILLFLIAFPFGKKRKVRLAGKK
ncbi:MAG: hypothetical protein KAT76_08165 [Bacteroidales bacterium]|nr:hypothetical protein [Bacteroidales bacterium]